MFIPLTAESTKVPAASAPPEKSAIEASESLYSLLRRMRTADIITVGTDNAMGAIPAASAIDTAQKLTWDKPSPIIARRFVTSDTPRSAEQTAIRGPAIRAFCTKEYDSRS